MSAPVFAAVAAIVLAAFVGGYVWGWLNGSARAAHAPQTCRDRLEAAKRAAEVWQGRARQLEGENKELRHAQAEHAAAETATVTMLLAELDQAAAAARVIDLRRDLRGAPAV